MTKSYSIDYGGKTYTIDGPDNATQQQVEAAVKSRIGQPPSAGNTVGGDLARGFAHGAEQSIGMDVGDEPQGKEESWPRWAGEKAGGIVPDIAAGFIPGGKAVKGIVGAGVGAMQPAKDWTERAKNAAIGGGSALLGQGAGRYITAHRGALNTLANEAIGGGFGYTHGGGWGSIPGAWAGRSVGHLVQSLMGGRGLADLVAALARNPGLAAAMGVKLAPYGEQAGQFVGQELGKPSQ